MLLDYRYLWEVGPPGDVDAGGVLVPHEVRIARVLDTRRALVPAESRVATVEVG